MRVAGTDPGTSSLDLLVLDDGRVADQHRIPAAELRADPAAPVRWLQARGPFDLVAGPSGYGLPLVRAADCTDRDLDLMALVRPDERGHDQGVHGFKALLRALRSSGLPVVFLPGVIHLPTVPPHRKFNRIDLGTTDKLCVAAIAALRGPEAGVTKYESQTAAVCVIELGSAFSACLVLDNGQVVDGVGGTGGPVGWRSGGAWDGETAYLLSPLSKDDLFAGGAGTVGGPVGVAWYRESLLRTVAGLRAVTPFGRMVLSGRLLDDRPESMAAITADLAQFGSVERLESLPGAWVKHAAQGSAVLADGLAGGRFAPLVERLRLREAAGTVLDWLVHPRAAGVRAAFGLSSPSPTRGEGGTILNFPAPPPTHAPARSRPRSPAPVAFRPPVPAAVRWHCRRSRRRPPRAAWRRAPAG